MPAEVDDERLVDGLAGQAGPCSARKNRHAIRGGRTHGGEDVLSRPRDENGMGHYLIQAGIGAVQDARQKVIMQVTPYVDPALGQKAGQSLAWSHASMVLRRWRLSNLALAFCFAQNCGII